MNKYEVFVLVSVGLILIFVSATFLIRPLQVLGDAIILSFAKVAQENCSVEILVKESIFSGGSIICPIEQELRSTARNPFDSAVYLAEVKYENGKVVYTLRNEKGETKDVVSEFEITHSEDKTEEYIKEGYIKITDWIKQSGRE